MGLCGCLRVVCALEWLCGNLRALRGVQRMRRQLEAGMAPDTEDLDASLRRRRRQNLVSWGICGLVAALAVSVFGSQQEMPLSDAPEPLPYVSMEAVAPEAAALPLDSSVYRERRSLLTDHRESASSAGILKRPCGPVSTGCGSPSWRRPVSGTLSEFLGHLVRGRGPGGGGQPL